MASTTTPSSCGAAEPRDTKFMIVDNKCVFDAPQFLNLSCDISGVLGDRLVPIAEADEHLDAHYGSTNDNDMQ